MTAQSRIKNLESRIKLLIPLFFILIALFLPRNAFAQTSTTSSSIPQTLYPIPSSVSPTSPLYTDLLVNNMFHTFSCLAIGQSVIGQPCLTYQLTKSAQGMIQGVPVLSQVNLSGGTLGAVTGVIGALYQNPPVRTADYLASVGKDLGFVKEAHAQVVGSGADVLNPILGLWQVSRNISYVIMIIIFIIIGLMVMFRTRINPQTVITAQAALPGLVVGLLLITFSYFLAGLVADTAFLGTNIVGYYFQAVQNKPPQNLINDISGHNVLSILSPFVKMVNVGSLSDAIASIWESLAAPNSSFLPWAFGPQQLLTSLAAMLIAQFVLPLGGLFGGVGQLIGGGIAVGYTVADPVHSIGFALTFVGMAVLIYAMFKLLLRLVNTYLSIIFLTISAPFQFLAAALPGRQGIATGWVLNMLANVLAFPAVLAVFYFVAFILGPDFVKQNCAQPCPFIISQSNQTEHYAFVPAAQAANGSTDPSSNGSIVGGATFPLLGGFDLTFIRFLLAFGAIVATPAIPDIIARTIGRVSQAGQLLGQEISGSVGQGQRYAGQFQQGVGGFAGQAGQLSSTPGYEPDVITRDPVTGRITNVTYKGSLNPIYGAKMGTWSRIKARLR